jgi:hypothetical protein
MKLRTLLRDEKPQMQLEKKGAAISSFLIPDNIAWLLQKKSEADSISNAEDAIALNEKLNEKLQSKVEYRCINCSPFEIYFSDLTAQKLAEQPFFLQGTITNEQRYAALHLIAPLLAPEHKGITFRYLAGAHLLPAPPRGNNIPTYYEDDADFVAANFSSLLIKPGQAAVFFSNVPYTFQLEQEEAGSIPLLEISVLPYEARPTIYELAQQSPEPALRPYEVKVEGYIKYKMGAQDEKNGMKGLREVPFSKSTLTATEKESLALKSFSEKIISKLSAFKKIYS